MLRGHRGSYSHEHLWNKGCLYEGFPWSNTRPGVAVEQTAVKHGHYKEAFKRSASPCSGSPGPRGQAHGGSRWLGSPAARRIVGRLLGVLSLPQSQPRAKCTLVEGQRRLSLKTRRPLFARVKPPQDAERAQLTTSPWRARATNRAAFNMLLFFLSMASIVGAESQLWELVLCPGQHLNLGTRLLRCLPWDCEVFHSLKGHLRRLPLE